MKTIAFFDLDYTLLDCSSSLMYVQEAVSQGRLPLWLVGYIGVMHRLNWLDFGDAHCRIIRYAGRWGYQEAQQFFTEWIERRLYSHVTKKGQAKIEWHQEQGHRVVIISATIEEIVKPMTEHLGLGEDYLCTKLVVIDDEYTGHLEGPVCYGPGKLHWAKKWGDEQGYDFSEVAGYFYTDSSSDEPLLRAVQNPVVVNPSRKLKKIAKTEGWPIEKFY